MYKIIQETIDEIKIKLELLEKKDKYFLYSHNYKKLSPLSSEEVVLLEKKLHLTLPEDFKAFITQVISGGAGPDYGLFAIQDMIENFEENGKINALSQEFGSKMKNEYYHEYRQDVGDILLRVPGVLPINDCGCAINNILILTGPEKGFIWCDGGYDGIGPMITADKKRFTFIEYYLAWLNRGLERLEAYELKNLY
ncbi:MAG: SMI1/KNR4 family protein, partial [Candidatus Thorarchaeota archaeon]